MRLYAVRVKETHEPLGFYWVKDVGELAIAVDHVADVADFEYRTVNGPTAIVWEGEVKSWRMGDPAADPASDRRIFEGAEFDGQLEGRAPTLRDFTNGAGTIGGWRPLSE